MKLISHIMLLLLFVSTTPAYGQEPRPIDKIMRDVIRHESKVAHQHTMTPADCEAVMVEGMSITFTYSSGKMTITAGKGFERHYTWAGGTRTVVMIPRKKRWYGSRGMYNPGSFISGELEPWKEHDGIKRYVVDEGQRHFGNIADANEWVQKRKKNSLGFFDGSIFIYNDSGLVIFANKSIPPPEMIKKGAPGTLSVEVWQLYINGKKPEKLEGSENEAIIVNYPPSYGMQTVAPPKDYVEQVSGP